MDWPCRPSVLRPSGPSRAGLAEAARPAPLQLRLPARVAAAGTRGLSAGLDAVSHVQTKAILLPPLKSASPRTGGLSPLRLVQVTLV